jgi:hypothetical protein
MIRSAAAFVSCSHEAFMRFEFWSSFDSSDINLCIPAAYEDWICLLRVHFASILYMELCSRPFGQFRSVLVPCLLALKLPLQDLIGKPASHKHSLIAEADFGGKPWFDSGLGHRR